MVKVIFSDFKDSALKFDNQASIAFVINKDEVWVKTGTRAKQLCYKESARVVGLADENATVSICLEHSAVQRGLDARISSNGIENVLTMVVDEEKKVASFEVEHILRIPATEESPEKVQKLGTSRRGPFKFETGYGATQTIGLPTGISDEVRTASEGKIDIVPSKTLAEVFDMLGVVKQPVFITAEEEKEDGVKIPSKAFVSGQLYGEMSIVPFKRGVRVSYELAAPVGKLLAKDSGNAECLARVDESKTRIFSVQTDSFYVSGVVEKVSAKSMNVAHLMTVAGLSYDAFNFTCPRALIANIVEGKQTIKFDGESLCVGDDTITVCSLNVDGESGERIKKALETGMAVDCTQIKKLLSSDDSVAIAVAEFIVEGESGGNTTNHVFRIGVPGGADNRPCWYLPAVSVKK